MIENKNTQKILGAIVVIILIGLVGWYIVNDLSLQDSIETGNTANEGSIETLVESGDAEIKEIPVNLDLNADSIIRPELNRAIVIPDRFNIDAEAIMRNNIETLKEQLKEDSNSFQAWSDLANQYNIIDDFEGAVEIWEFLNITTKGNVGVLISIGNVYHYQLKDYKKSEEAFNEALEIDKYTIGAYTGLHELYRYSYKTDTTLAVDILKKGLDVMTEDVDLRMLLASYYTELGMKDEAAEVYEEVLAKARVIGNTNLVTIIEAAVESLK